MSDFDWKKLVSVVAPTIGTMLGGPLAGSAIAALSNVFLGNENGTEAEVSQAILNGMTPDKIVELKRINLEHEQKMAELGIDLAKINQSLEVAYITDTADARKYKDVGTFWLGVVILIVFGVTMGMSLYGSYQILKGGITILDVSAVAAVSGFIGSIIGYVAASAQQVVSYFYGSSAGSKQKTDAMSNSFKNLPLNK